MTVPDSSWFDPVLNATLHTGYDAREQVAALRSGLTIAVDIETPGLATFDVNCVTAAWHDGGGVHAVLLDPSDATQWALIADLIVRAGKLVLHNSPFDVPILHHQGLISKDSINKVTDTLITARMAIPDPYVSKSLSACVQRWLGVTELKGGIETAFKAAGFPTQQAGYENMTIDSPIYRLGAMADTVMTLRLLPEVTIAAINWLTEHPFAESGATNAAQARALIDHQQTVNRVMLRRSAVGLAVDRDYLVRYIERVETERQRAEALLAGAGLTGGAGKAAGLIRYLRDRGELPQPWPTTPKGAPRATKADLDGLNHPLAQAQRTLAESDKILSWLGKVDAQAALTGRCHPQCNVLGASQSGRMSYSHPELHQFSEHARPIIADDGQGLTSIDWSQIEPVTMSLMARDAEFLAPFEAGADLYEPIQRACGVERKIAKKVLLATMYGQGVTSLSREIGHTVESAAQIRRQMFLAMPRCAQWMTKVTTVAETYRRVITAGGRILSVPIDARDGSAMTFRSVNHVVQGSAYDVLAHTIVAMEEAGMGDHLQLTMHDEVVVDTEVATDVRKIMETLPPFLERLAGRSAHLRTDSADMGHQWLQV